MTPRKRAGAGSRTIWHPVLETVVDPRRIPLVFGFEFVLTRPPVPPGKDVRNQLIILAELREGLVGGFSRLLRMKDRKRTHVVK